jgi:hypothetical protein
MRVAAHRGVLRGGTRARTALNHRLATGGRGFVSRSVSGWHPNTFHLLKVTDWQSVGFLRPKSLKVKGGELS